MQPERSGDEEGNDGEGEEEEDGHARGSRGEPDDSWIPPDLALLPASGLKDSWMPRTLFMSHSSSARGN